MNEKSFFLPDKFTSICTRIEKSQSYLPSTSYVECLNKALEKAKKISNEYFSVFYIVKPCISTPGIEGVIYPITKVMPAIQHFKKWIMQSSLVIIVKKDGEVDICRKDRLDQPLLQPSLNEILSEKSDELSYINKEHKSVR